MGIKTREIDVWMNEEQLDSDVMYTYIDQKYAPGTKKLKAKLIIEIPEKKIEISESELAVALDISQKELKEKDERIKQLTGIEIFDQKKYGSLNDQRNFKQ